jgi:superfamily I DNA and RNA helicase
VGGLLMKRTEWAHVPGAIILASYLKIRATTGSGSGKYNIRAVKLAVFYIQQHSEHVAITCYIHTSKKETKE